MIPVRVAEEHDEAALPNTLPPTGGVLGTGCSETSRMGAASCNRRSNHAPICAIQAHGGVSPRSAALAPGVGNSPAWIVTKPSVLCTDTRTIHRSGGPEARAPFGHDPSGRVTHARSECCAPRRDTAMRLIAQIGAWFDRRFAACRAHPRSFRASRAEETASVVLFRKRRPRRVPSATRHRNHAGFNLCPLCSEAWNSFAKFESRRDFGVVHPRVARVGARTSRWPSSSFTWCKSSFSRLQGFPASSPG